MQRRNQEKQRKSEYENKELGVKLLRKSKAIEKVSGSNLGPGRIGTAAPVLGSRERLNMNFVKSITI